MIAHPVGRIWTKTSEALLLGWMKPKPLVALKNFTVPYVMRISLQSVIQILFATRECTANGSGRLWAGRSSEHSGRETKFNEQDRSMGHRSVRCSKQGPRSPRAAAHTLKVA